MVKTPQIAALPGCTPLGIRPRAYKHGDRVQILTPHWNGSRGTVSHVHDNGRSGPFVYVTVDGLAKPGVRDGLAIFHVDNVKLEA